MPLSRKANRVTIKDVAEAAGVTAATVSNVVRGKSLVAEPTRAKVQAAIRELRYTPNLVARGLVSRKTNTIAFVLPDISNPFYPEIALEIERVAMQNELQVLMCNTMTDTTRGRTVLQRLHGAIVDGVVVMDGGVLPEDVVGLIDAGIPVVACLFETKLDNCADPLLGRVEVDFYSAARQCTRCLIEHGHRRIGAVMDVVPDMTTGHHRRLEGVRDELATHGLSLAQAHIVPSASSIRSGRECLARLADAGDLPTAIVAGNDLIAVGLMTEAFDRGISVPAQLSVTGIDNIRLGRNVRPALTTCDVPKEGIAGAAMRLLAAMASGTTQSKVVLETTLVMRASVSAPADGGAN